MRHGIHLRFSIDLPSVTEVQRGTHPEIFDVSSPNRNRWRSSGPKVSISDNTFDTIYLPQLLGVGASENVNVEQAGLASINVSLRSSGRSENNST